MGTDAPPLALVASAVLLALIAGSSQSEADSPLAVVDRREVADPSRRTAASRLGTPEDMQERWVLRNVSGKPIDAWQVACVYGIQSGRWAWSGPGADRFGSPPGPDPTVWKDSPLLAPEETIEVRVPIAPLRSSPHEVWSCAPAAVIFSDATTWGSPKILDRLFAWRVEQAREAIRFLDALERIEPAAARRQPDLDEIASVLDAALPQDRLGSYRQEVARLVGRSTSEGIAASLELLTAAVRDDVDQMLQELRPEDLDRLADRDRR